MRAAEDPKKLLENLKTFDSCVIPAGFSFVNKDYRPPKSMDEMRASCKRQAEMIKCLKDRTKNSPALVRRSMLAYANGRQKHHKKYCTNLASQQTRDFVDAMSCVMNKRLDSYLRSDSIFANSIEEIKRLDMNDSSVELKQICCALYKLRRVSYLLYLNKSYLCYARSFVTLFAPALCIELCMSFVVVAVL